MHLSLGHDAFREGFGLEEGDGVGLLAGPRFFVLAPALVLGVGRGVSLEAKRVHLRTVQANMRQKTVEAE